MDVPVTEEQIRTLALYLWEKDGGPEGRAEEYWERARQQLVPNAFSEKPKPAGKRPQHEKKARLRGGQAVWRTRRRRSISLSTIRRRRSPRLVHRMLGTRHNIGEG